MTIEHILIAMFFCDSASPDSILVKATGIVVYERLCTSNDKNCEEGGRASLDTFSRLKFGSRKLPPENTRAPSRGAFSRDGGEEGVNRSKRAIVPGRANTRAHSEIH